MKKDDGSQVPQIRAGRALLGWSQKELADKAGVGTSTVADFERGKRTPIPATIQALQRALETAGVHFVPNGAQLGGPPPPSPITPIRWVEASDLTRWAEKFEAAFKLPELVSRLVLASLGSDVHVRFPSGAGVWAAGTDGEVTTSAVGHRYVPTGSSIWELTLKKGTQRKAQDDYDKDTSARGTSAAKETFVFVTLRRWADKERWVADRKREGVWRDVRAYDVDDLIHWLDLTPSVGAWFAETTGKRPPGIRDLDGIWNEWSNATVRPLTTALVRCDRDGRRDDDIDRGDERNGGDVAVIRRWLDAPPAILELRATSALEVLAFLHAAIDRLDVHTRARHQARCLVATTADTARGLLDATTPMMVALTEPDAGLARQLVARGHHVLLAYDDRPTVGGHVHTLTKPSRDGIAAALVEMGIPEPQAEKYARDCARDLTILRRLMPAAAAEVPAWATRTPPRALLAALLAGAWDERIAGDREQLASIADEPYGAVAAALTPFVGDHDHPLRRIGATWHVASPRDAWMLLARFVVSTELDRFADAVATVLGTVDPRYAMNPEDRSTAVIHGVEPRYSDALRHGLGQVLILLALWGDQCGSAPGAHRRVEHIVDELLADADAARWWSLGGELRLLAEAAPGAFLSAVEASLAQPEPAVCALLATHEGGPLGGGEYFSNLRWALPTLAWSPQWLPRVTYILADLDGRDARPGRRADRAISGLHEIFVMWHPQTYATLDERLTIIDGLRRRSNEAAWKLLLSLLPQHQEATTNTPTARWRDVQPDRPAEKVTRGLALRGIAEITTRLLEEAGTDDERWVQLVDRLEDLGPSPDVGIDALERVEPELTAPAARAKVWAALRRQLHRHREFPGVTWAMAKDVVDRLAALYARLEPLDLVGRYAWLFDDHPELPTPSGAGWQADASAVDTARREAARTLLTDGGVEAILSVAGQVDAAGYLGPALYDGGLDEHTLDALLAESVRSDVANVRNLAHGLIRSAHAHRGDAWALRLWTHATHAGWGDTALVTILLALPQRRPTWELAASGGPAVETSYWQRFPTWWQSDDPATVEYAIRRLLAADRPDTAIYVIDRRSQAPVASELIITTLKQVAAQGQGQGQPSESAARRASTRAYHVANIFEQLDRRDDVTVQQIAELEWIFLQHLQHSARPPKALPAALATDPKLFVDFLCLLYKPSADSGVVEPAAVIDEQARLRAMQAFHLFEGWNVIPGARADTTIDADALETWIKSARTRASEVGRLGVADLHIGKVLATSPKGADGHWPAEAVRDAIDLFRSRDLEDGFTTGVYNRRGATTRGLRDGGTLERDEAARYRAWASAVRITHPRTGAALDAIADGYERDAVRHDERAAHIDYEY